MELNQQQTGKMDAIVMQHDVCTFSWRDRKGNEYMIPYYEVDLILDNHQFGVDVDDSTMQYLQKYRKRKKPSSDCNCCKNDLL